MDIALLIFYIACLAACSSISAWVRYKVLNQEYMGWLGWGIAATFVFILVLQQYNETKTDRPSYARLAALEDQCQQNSHDSQVTLYKCAVSLNQCVTDRSELLTFKQTEKKP